MTKNIIQSPENRRDFQELIKKYSHCKIIIKAYAEWCKPCKIIDNHIYELFEKLNIRNKLLILLNVDKQQDVASYLKIRALPTIITYEDGMKQNVVEGVDIEYLTQLFRGLEK